MTTHEDELTAPVDLCTPDGLWLNRDALGWSRQPLHRANLRGRFGVNKQWDYWATLAPVHDKHTVLPGRDKGAETHQMFGRFSGWVRTDDDETITFEGLQGFAEEARQEW